MELEVTYLLSRVSPSYVCESIWAIMCHQGHQGVRFRASPPKKTPQHTNETGGHHLPPAE